jgi:hypothetical protein
MFQRDCSSRAVCDTFLRRVYTEPLRFPQKYVIVNF